MLPTLPTADQVADLIAESVRTARTLRRLLPAAKRADLERSRGPQAAKARAAALLAGLIDARAAGDEARVAQIGRQLAAMGMRVEFAGSQGGRP